MKHSTVLVRFTLLIVCLFVLVVALPLSNGKASTLTGDIRTMWSGGTNGEVAYVLSTGGNVFVFTGSSWALQSQFNPPVPVNEVNQWSPRSFVSTSGDFFYWENGSWNNYGTPDDPVMAKKTTWSELKPTF